jgi:hypothetical protein
MSCAFRPDHAQVCAERKSPIQLPSVERLPTSYTITTLDEPASHSFRNHCLYESTRQLLDVLRDRKHALIVELHFSERPCSYFPSHPGAAGKSWLLSARVLKTTTKFRCTDTIWSIPLTPGLHSTATSRLMARRWSGMGFILPIMPGTWEIRPLVDQELGRWDWALNLTLDRSFHGEGVKKGDVFSPNFKFSHDFTPKIAGGLEY